MTCSLKRKLFQFCKMNDKKHIVEQMDAGFEKAETDLLKEALKRTPEERYYVMTRLMKVGIMLKNAKISHRNPLKSQSK
jgi:type III secretory pathway component EscV